LCSCKSSMIAHTLLSSSLSSRALISTKQLSCLSSVKCAAYHTKSSTSILCYSSLSSCMSLRNSSRIYNGLSVLSCSTVSSVYIRELLRRLIQDDKLE
jgi:hypothetical protein